MTVTAKFLPVAAFAVILGLACGVAHAENSVIIPERILGKADAPVTVEEYASLTCSHCAEFTDKTLPELEKKYVATGKVRFILRDFPLDGTALKAAALARCMPAEQYYPFVKTLYKNQGSWAFGGLPEAEKILTQYAKLGGLPEAKAKACLQDTKLQDALVAARIEASQKTGVEATPTFIINNGAETVKGAKPVAEFAAAFDRLLAPKGKDDKKTP